MIHPFPNFVPGVFSNFNVNLQKIQEIQVYKR